MFINNSPFNSSPIDSSNPILGLKPSSEMGIENQLTDMNSVDHQTNPDGSIEMNLDFGGSNGLQIPFGANLVDYLEKDEIDELYVDLIGKIEDDIDSREGWEKVFADTLELLGLNRDDDFEHNRITNIASVVHPILAESAIKIQSKALQELFPPKGPVRSQVNGVNDPAAVAKANRVETYLNYLLTTKMEEYMPESDRMLFYLALSGSAFRKVYWDTNKERPRSLFLPAEDVIVPDSVVDIDDSPRVTQKIRINANDLKKLQRSGFYSEDVDLGETYDIKENEIEKEVKRIEGRSSVPTNQDQYLLYEVHCDYDLEGFEDRDEKGEETGIALPYIITIDSESNKVLSIRRNYQEKDPLKKKINWFVHHKLTTGLGFYGYGLVHLIGNNAKVATQTLRDIVIAGAFANFPAGFKAKGMRTSQADDPLLPGEFRDIDVPLGTKITDIISPLPYKGADPGLIQTHQYIVSSAQKFADETGAVLNEATNYGPVGTTMALLEASSRFYGAIHRRLHGSLRKEFALLVRILKENRPETYPYNTGSDPHIFDQDFDGSVDVVPVSDPNITSSTQRIALAREQLTSAQQSPDIHDLKEAYRRYYMALGVDNINALLPDKSQKPAPPLDPVGEIQSILNNKPVQAYEAQDNHAHLQALYNFMADPQYGANPLINSKFSPQFNALISQHLGFAYKKDIQIMAGQPIQGLSGPQQNPDMDNAVALVVANASTHLLVRDQELGASNTLPPPAAMDAQLSMMELDQRDKERDSREKLKMLDLNTKREIQASQLEMAKEELKAKMLRDQHDFLLGKEKIHEMGRGTDLKHIENRGFDLSSSHHKKGR